MKRIFLIVLDSVGVGYEPDAEKFGDVGANTMKSISLSSKFNAKNLIKLGLGNIDGIDFLKQEENPIGAFGKMREKSMGKDTTTGHWEIAGIESKTAMPTFPNGFDKDVLDEFSKQTGRGILCNKTYSGTEVIKDYGEQHLESGDLIVYTSADSVFQIAAHESIVPPEKLYEYCKIARKILVGKNAVGRVIARPFTGNFPFERTPRRHDFSLEPTGKTMLDCLKKNGFDTVSIGKIYDIFAHRGITDFTYTVNNNDGMNKTFQALEKDFNGLCFVNLVDFDMLYGHRRDVDGYANALAEFDSWLGKFLPMLQEDDMLMITADHGCDPAFLKTTDHTREYIPLLVYGKQIKSQNLGTRETFSDIAATICDIFDVEYSCGGKSFKGEILK